MILDQATVDVIAVAIAQRLGQGAGVPELFSIKDTARQLGLDRTTVYKMIDEGTLRIRRLGGRTLVKRESIVNLIA